MPEKKWPAAVRDGILKRPRRLATLAGAEAGSWLLDTVARGIGQVFTVVMWAAVIAWCTAEPWIAQERNGSRRAP